MSGADPALAPWLQRQLETLLTQRGHALLLAGPSGLGQYELALALARAWLCEEASPQGACGHCASCHAIDVRTHADLRVLMPETVSLEKGWPLDEGTQKELDDKKRKPSRLIRVEAARTAVAFTQLTRSRASAQVILVYPADRMNMESANTLLKTLEEPLGEVRFVLATEAADQLLPTIRSRCQTHTLQWPEPSEALTWLQAEVARLSGKPTSVEQAQVWLQAAGGRPMDALGWAAAGLQNASWQQIPQALVRGDWALLADWPPSQQLEVLQKVCHDLMALQAGAAPRYFATQSLPSAPGWAALSAWSKELFASARTVEHPFNAGLMQQAWSSRAQQVLSRGGTS